MTLGGGSVLVAWWTTMFAWSDCPTCCCLLPGEGGLNVTAFGGFAILVVTPPVSAFLVGVVIGVIEKPPPPAAVAVVAEVVDPWRFTAVARI